MVQGWICGVDEVGRGPWAGPVVAAAVMLPAGVCPPGVTDSKKLSPARRAALVAPIRAAGLVGLGAASVAEIDRLNILQATWLAMRRALAALPAPPDAALIDGNRVPPGLSCPAQAVVGGDACVPAIAAASIVAKVVRDRAMARLAPRYPAYGWERNAGYGVAAHRAALMRLGVTPHHRRSFRPVHNILCEEEDITH